MFLVISYRNALTEVFGSDVVSTRFETSRRREVLPFYWKAR